MKEPEHGTEGQELDISEYLDSEKVIVEILTAALEDPNPEALDLSEKSSTDSREVSEGIVLDYDAEGNLVGIDIDNASAKVNLDQLVLNKLPSEVKSVAA